jgi:eukaryotic-like serine/threonine-protein kinase
MAENQNNIMFDKFEIIECLKKDEYTGVYLARHIYLNKNIILKSLNTNTVPDNTIVERFKREAKILAHLDHPNIIKVLDFGTHEKYFYISFEYLQGSSLREVIKENTISLAQKKEIVIQILQGLTEAHNNGIIHRDIKPENIFVDNNLRVKIGDFGLALSNTESFVTSKAAIVGTPCYMSPEQIGGAKLEPRSDLFSLGIVIYELYLNSNPFLGNDISESINNIISKDYKKLLVDIDKLPDDIRAIIKKLLAKNVSERFKSTIEVLKELGVDVLTPANYTTITMPKVKVGKYSRNIIIAASILLIFVAGYFYILKSGTEKITIPGNNDSIEMLQSGDTLQNDVKVPEDKIVDTSKLTNTLTESPKNNNTVENTPASEKTIDVAVNEGENDIPEPVTVVKKFGYVNIECIPWAKILIDSTEYDTTPIEKPIRLTEGKHKLVLSHPQFPKYEETINIFPDETKMVKVSLDTLYGYLDCQVFPWGELYINNRHIGQTPLTTPLQLVPGNYTLKILNPNFDEIRDTLKISRNDTLSIQYSFTK